MRLRILGRGFPNYRKTVNNITKRLVNLHLPYISCCYLVSKSCLTLAAPWTELARLLCPWHFPQEYWSVLPFPSPGGLLNPGVEPAFPALAGRFFTAQPSGKPLCLLGVSVYKSKESSCSLFHQSNFSKPHLTRLH